MIVLVCGGRDYCDWDALDDELSCLPITKIVHGDAKGADFLAKAWARSLGVEEVEYPANWSKYGHSAGPIRNREMLEKEDIDLVVAFPGGRGTEDMVKQATEKGITVRRVPE